MLLAALMVSASATVAAETSGGATLELRARVAESTCALSFSGGNGATLDFGEWSYSSIGTAAAPKYQLYPVGGRGEITADTIFGISVTADPACPTQGKMVVSISGFTALDFNAMARGAKLLKGFASGLLVAPRLNADGSEAASPYYFPYDIGFYFQQSSGDCTGVFGSMPVVNSASNSLSTFNCYSDPGAWGSSRQHKGGYVHTLSAKQIFVSSGALNAETGYISANGTLATAAPDNPPDESAYARLEMFFVGPMEITTLWGNDPPPPGTKFTGQLTLTASYL